MTIFLCINLLTDIIHEKIDEIHSNKKVNVLNAS